MLQEHGTKQVVSMAIYHLHDQAVSKSSGRSPLAMAAYRAGDRLVEMVLDGATGITTEVIHDYTRKGNVVHRQIMAPDYAPSWMRERNSLWQGIMQAEKRKDGVYLHEMDVAIPLELSQTQAIALVQDFVQQVFVGRGIVVDFSIHWEEGNPHAHIMQATREIINGKFGNKNRDWHRKEGLRLKRLAWAEIVNAHLLKHGCEIAIDHRSYKAQGIHLVPSRHEGVVASEIEFKGLVSVLKENNRIIALENKKRIEEDPAIVIKKLSQERVTFTERDIAKEIFRRVQGEEGNYQEIMAKIMASPALKLVIEKDLKGDRRYTYQGYDKIEKELFAMVKEMAKSKTKRKQNNRAVEALIGGNHQLTVEQQDAVFHLTNEERDLMVMIGKAGTGKTTTLELVTRYYNAQGYSVKGAALAGIAAVNLAEKATTIESRTLASWEARWSAGECITKQEVWIVDEAGMLGVEAMHGIVKRVKEAGAKLILVGDDKQLQPIASGQALRGIMELTNAVQITQVFRQKQSWMREATEDFSKGEIFLALKAYEEKKKICWTRDNQATLKQIARDYVEDRERDKIEQKENSSIILAIRRSDIKILNQLVRDTLKKQGELETGSLFLTASGQKEFALGDHVVLLKNHNGALQVRNGMRGIVTGYKGSILYVQVGDKKKRQIAIDTMLYPDIDYGYASTIHKVQGLTVSRSYVVMDRYLDKYSTYVACSRHEQELRLYVNQTIHPDIGVLASTLEREGAQHLVSDFTVSRTTKTYRQQVDLYLGYALQARQLLERMRHWQHQSQQKIFMHQDWQKFKDVVSKRRELAKLIYSKKMDHAKFLKEAGVRLNRIKRHAEIYSPEMLTKSEKQERALVHAYEQMEPKSIERLRHAYIIVSRSKQKPAFYRYVLEESGITTTSLMAEVEQYKSRLLIQQKEHRYLDDRYAALAFTYNKAQLGMLYQEVQHLRASLYQAEEKIKPWIKRIEQEKQRIADYAHDMILHERRLKKIEGEGLLLRQEVMKEYDQAQQHKDMAQAALEKIYNSSTYQQWNIIMQQYERELGRFNHDKDVAWLKAQLRNERAVEPASENKKTFDCTIKDSLVLLKSYHELYLLAQEHRRLKKEKDYVDVEIETLVQKKKRAEGQLQLHVNTLKVSAPNLFKEAASIGLVLTSSDKKQWVELYNRLDHYKMVKPYKWLTLPRHKKQQANKKVQFRKQLKELLETLEAKEKIDTRLSEYNNKRTFYQETLKREYSKKQLATLDAQLHVSYEKINSVFMKFGSTKIKEVQTLVHDKKAFDYYLQSTLSISQKDRTLEINKI